MTYLECPLHSNVQDVPSKDAQEFMAKCKNCSVKNNCDHLKSLFNTYGATSAPAKTDSDNQPKVTTVNEHLWVKTGSAHCGEYIRTETGDIGRVISRATSVLIGKIPVHAKFQDGQVRICNNYAVLHGCPEDVGIDKPIEIQHPDTAKEVKRDAQIGDYIKVLIDDVPFIVKITEIPATKENAIFVVGEDTNGNLAAGPLKPDEYVVLEGYTPKLDKTPKKEKNTWSDVHLNAAYAWNRAMVILLMDERINISFRKDGEEVSCYLFTPTERVRAWVKRYHEEDSDDYEIACMYALDKTLRKGHIFERYMHAAAEPSMPDLFKHHVSDDADDDNCDGNDCDDDCDGNEDEYCDLCEL